MAENTSEAMSMATPVVSAPNRKALSSGSTATQTMDAEKMSSIHSAPQTAAATPTAATAMPMIEALPDCPPQLKSRPAAALQRTLR